MSTATFPNEIERYYRKFYERREDRPSEDVCVLAHSNKVCLITLVPDHAALRSGPVQKLEYVVETGGKKVGDVHGKRKLEAIKLKIGTPLCKVTSGDGTVYTINSPIKGKLCELNDNLVNDLTLLTQKPGSNGYLAIVLHYTCSDDDFLDHLLTADQYANGDTIPVKKNDDAGDIGISQESVETKDVSKPSGLVIEIDDKAPDAVDDENNVCGRKRDASESPQHKQANKKTKEDDCQ